MGPPPDGAVVLQDFRARKYVPAHGRWLQRDPMGYADGTNLYEAFGSNPTANVDPMGTQTPIFCGYDPVTAWEVYAGYAPRAIADTKRGRLASGWLPGNKVFYQQIYLLTGKSHEFSVGTFEVRGGAEVIVCRDPLVEGGDYAYLLPLTSVVNWSQTGKLTSSDYQTFVRRNYVERYELWSGEAKPRPLAEYLANTFAQGAGADQGRAPPG
jgi:RHS repeat-associated protein